MRYPIKVPEILSTDAVLALAALTAMEIVLGIDNVVFIAIVAARLPPAQQPLARRLGLSLALGIRILLLLAISWIMGLTAPLVSVGGHGVSGRDLILLAGGLFLIAKATWEIYDKLEVEHHERSTPGGRGLFIAVLVQILLLDIVFSLDSVITAVGMARELAVMVAAVVIAVLVMLVAARPIGQLVERHPSLKILALSFLLLIGTALVAEAAHVEIPKGYIYFAMGFSVFVELLNIRAHAHAAPVHLRDAYTKEREIDSPPGPA
jgi:predicted tellurium resistance membrane protein TerC